MALVLEDKSIDRTKVLKMALVHDLAEALVGDITPHDAISKEEKNKLEANAMSQIKMSLPNQAGG